MTTAAIAKEKKRVHPFTLETGRGVGYLRFRVDPDNDVQIQSASLSGVLLIELLIHMHRFATS